MGEPLKRRVADVDSETQGAAMGDEMEMHVEFYKAGDGRLCGWMASPPKRRPFQGTTMAAGRDLPHDLTQFVIERELGIRDGFWGLLAHGAWFASVPGRRSTQPGRALARAYDGELAAVEGIVNTHYLAWRRGEPTPVGPALEAMYVRWRALAQGERLVLKWPMQRLSEEQRLSRPTKNCTGRIPRSLRSLGARR